jgi:carboxyl-terminal processing protease
MISRKAKKILGLIAAVSISLLMIVLPVSLKVSTAKEAQYVKTLNQVWNEVNSNFFDPKFNGIDWNAKRDEYTNRVKSSQSIEEASAVINQMLSELNTSHTRFYSKLEPAYYQLLGIFSDRGFSKQIKKVFPDGKIDYPGIGIFTHKRLNYRFNELLTQKMLNKLL